MFNKDPSLIKTNADTIESSLLEPLWLIILFVIKKTMGLRVDTEEELKGLDLTEHGMDAYSDFRLNQH